MRLALPSSLYVTTAPVPESEEGLGVFQRQDILGAEDPFPSMTVNPAYQSFDAQTPIHSCGLPRLLA
jgi:hypothetical protein